MKIIEILNKWHLPITNEENDLLLQFDEGAVVYKKDLTDRQQLVANQLVIKEVLRRQKNNGKTCYVKKIKK